MLSLKSADGTKYPLKSGTVLLVGRSPTCDLVLQDPSISKNHASLSLNSDGIVVLKDLNSLNGSSVNNAKLDHGGTRELKAGDRIYFGKVGQPFDVVNTNGMQPLNPEITPDSAPRSRSPAFGRPPATENRAVIDLERKISLVNRPHFSKIDHLASEEPPPIPPVQFPYAPRAPVSPNSDLNIQPNRPSYHLNDHPQYAVDFDNRQQRSPRLQIGERTGSPGFTGAGRRTGGGDTSAVEKARALFEDEREAIINTYENKLKSLKERYESELLAYEQEKAKLGLTLNDLDRKLVHKEENFLNVQERLQRAQNSQFETSEENNKVIAKYRAVSLYASDLQRQVDTLKRDNFEKNQRLNELSDRDWTKRLIECQNLIEQLRAQLLEKENAIGELKRITNLAGNGGPGSELLHFKSFIEQQSKELQNSKRVIHEYEQRENICSRKWNALLQENLKNAELASSLSDQFKRQKDHFQGLITTGDRKLAMLNSKIPQLMHTIDKRQAGQFLVEQMQLVQEERRALVAENQKLHLMITDLNIENESLRRRMEGVGLTPLQAPPQQYQTADYFQNQQLYAKIEELRDVVHELKEQGGGGRVVALEAQIDSLNLEIAQKNKKLEEQGHFIANLEKRTDTSFDESQAVKFFQTALAERDEQISMLRAQLQMQQQSASQLGVEKDELSRRVQKTSAENQRLKERHVQIAEVAFNQPKAYVAASQGSGGAGVISPLGQGLGGEGAGGKSQWID